MTTDDAAWSAAQTEIETLRIALETRTVIARATGILAGSLGCPTDTAWRLLRSASMDTNIRLYEVAELIVRTHDGVPGAADADRGRRVADALARAAGHTPPTRAERVAPEPDRVLTPDAVTAVATTAA